MAQEGDPGCAVWATIIGFGLLLGAGAILIGRIFLP